MHTIIQSWFFEDSVKVELGRPSCTPFEQVNVEVGYVCLPAVFLFIHLEQ
jgi:hypothetical protein